MKVSRIGQAAALLSVAALSLTACGSDNATGTAAPSTPAAGSSGAAVSGTLTGSGSSAQNSAMEAWKVGFQDAHQGANVQYSPDGSGAGRKAFLAGGAQFGGSDAYLDDDEMEAATEICGPDGALNIPAYISPISVAFNLEGVESLRMDAETIAKVFKKEITAWSDPAIAAQNEGIELPDTAITVVHRSDESGTTENFVEYLAAAAQDVWTYDVSGDWPADLQSENAKGTSGVVSTTTSTPGAITYADASATGGLGQVHVKVGEEYTELSAEAAAKAVEASEPVEGRPALDMSLNLERDTTESGAYPIVLVSYELFCTSYEDQETVDLVKAFGEFMVSDEGQGLAADSAGSAPMSEGLRERALEAIASIKVAS